MKVGIVLSGGFAKGAYQVGALRAISEFIPFADIAGVSAASIGAPNAYAFATGKLDLIEKMWHTVCDTDSRLFITSLLRSSLLQQNIKGLYSENDKISVPLYVPYLEVTNISNLSVTYKDLSKVSPEKLPRYLKASIAFPLYNKAVKIGERCFFDGAIIDNIPVYPLLEHELDYIICLYFDDVGYKFEDKRFDDKVIKIIFPNSKSVRSALLVEPNDIDNMLSEGYERTMYILRSIFANGHEDLDFIYRAIGIHNKHIGSPKLRITGDIVVANVNKALSMFLKRKNIT